METPIEGAGPALALIAPLRLAPGAARPVATPYGAVAAWRGALGPADTLWLDPAASPLAALYAAREAGAARVVELVAAQPHNRLLDAGDLVLPDDLVDRTELGRYTFFAGKGYGFLSQREPFCPALRAALLDAARAHTPRAFARAVYLAGPGAQAAAWGCDISGDGVVPASYLARELELCYAPLAVVLPVAEESGVRSQASGAGGRGESKTFFSGDALELPGWLPEALAHMPPARDCLCASAMQQYRNRGDIGPDWRTWLG